MTTVLSTKRLVTVVLLLGVVLLSVPHVSGSDSHPGVSGSAPTEVLWFTDCAWPRVLLTFAM
jgi:hypothetical protein